MEVWTVLMDLMRDTSVAGKEIALPLAIQTKAGIHVQMDQDVSKRNMFVTPPLSVLMEVTRAPSVQETLIVPPVIVLTNV